MLTVNCPHCHAQNWAHVGESRKCIQCGREFNIIRTGHNDSDTSERCETCEHWIQQYMNAEDKSDGVTDMEISYAGKKNIIIKYGECEKATLSRNPDVPNPYDTGANLLDGKVEMFVKVDEYEAILYTRKDHCCKCWEKKEG